jgi:hypothetical protein
MTGASFVCGSPSAALEPRQIERPPVPELGPEQAVKLRLHNVRHTSTVILAGGA